MFPLRTVFTVWYDVNLLYFAECVLYTDNSCTIDGSEENYSMCNICVQFLEKSRWQVRIPALLFLDKFIVTLY